MAPRVVEILGLSRKGSVPEVGQAGFCCSEPELIVFRGLFETSGVASKHVVLIAEIPFGRRVGCFRRRSSGSSSSTGWFSRPRRLVNSCTWGIDCFVLGGFPLRVLRKPARQDRSLPNPVPAHVVFHRLAASRFPLHRLQCAVSSSGLQAFAEHIVDLVLFGDRRVNVVSARSGGWKVVAFGFGLSPASPSWAGAGAVAASGSAGFASGGFDRGGIVILNRPRVLPPGRAGPGSDVPRKSRQARPELQPAQPKSGDLGFAHDRWRRLAAAARWLRRPCRLVALAGRGR